jgi:DNA-binding response OmpR family regulator
MARILLVDDEEYVRQLSTDELTEEGHEVLTSASEHALLRRIAFLQPQVVILDIKLVDYDGLELLQEIRGTYHNLPVILCSAYDTYKYDQKAFAADYYVVKSFDLTELKVAVRKTLEANKSVQLTA